MRKYVFLEAENTFSGEYVWHTNGPSAITRVHRHRLSSSGPRGLCVQARYLYVGEAVCCTAWIADPPLSDYRTQCLCIEAREASLSRLFRAKVYPPWPLQKCVYIVSTEAYSPSLRPLFHGCFSYRLWGAFFTGTNSFFRISARLEFGDAPWCAWRIGTELPHMPYISKSGVCLRIGFHQHRADV
jgi:hypothetical protein